MAKHNRYQRRAGKQMMMEKLSSRLDTKGSIKHSAMETGKDVLIGVLVGGLSASLIGRPAFLVGLGITGLGHYTGNTLASTVGLGMMAAGNVVGKSVSDYNGMDGVDGIKERMQAFKDSIMERTYLDKVIKKKESISGTIGELQYFDYGQMSGADVGAISDNPELYGDMSGLAALDAIDQQIEQAGMARLEGTDMGEYAEVGAVEEEVGMLPAPIDGLDYADVSDYNF